MEEKEIIIFEWIDAAMLGVETIKEEDVKKNGLISGMVAGFLVEETKDSFKVALDYFPEENTYRCVNIYPKTGVIKESIMYKEIKPISKLTTK